MEIALSRPEKKNALNLAAYRALSQALDQAAANPAVQVVLIHGLGGDFTAGNDIRDFASNPPVTHNSPVLGFLRRLTQFEKVLIAAVEGWAVGVGTTMLLHCDLIVASEEARFQLPFVDLGLCPEAASSYLLPRQVGHPKAMELFLTGRPFYALEALQMGLINEVKPKQECLARARELAEVVAAKPPQALRATKALVRGELKGVMEEVMRTEVQHFAQLLQGAEAQEAFARFLGKKG